MAISNESTGLKTRKMYINSNSIVIKDAQFFDGWEDDGSWDGTSISGGNGSKQYLLGILGSRDTTKLFEDDYIDLGIVTDEKEDLSIGAITLSIPGTGAGDRINWAIGGKVLRLTITGIIPDGVYIPIRCATADKWTMEDTIGGGGSDKDDPLFYSDVYGDPATPSTLMSNTSVFRFKMNRLLAQRGFNLTNNASPARVKYRRKYINETLAPGTVNDNIGNYTVTGYGISFIQGTRNLRYTITLDLSNNQDSNLRKGIRPRAFGDIN